MPHLRELVELHKNDPFALIGINTNDPEKEYRAGLKQHGVTWLSAYQGAGSPISSLYKVTVYPTYVLVGADGTIVARGHDGKEFDQKIADLIAKQKAQ
jgi:hypothetical protein